MPSRLLALSSGLFVILVSLLVLAQSTRAPVVNRSSRSSVSQEAQPAVAPTLPQMPNGTRFAKTWARAPNPAASPSATPQPSGLNFAPAVSYHSGGWQATSVAVADVNGDGKPDLLVSNSCAVSNCNNNGSVGVLLGNGDGTFQTAVAYDSGGRGADSVAVADVNGDGKPDLLVANSTGFNGSFYNGSVAVLLGNGDGTFQPAVVYGSGGAGAVSVAVADVNGDVRPDLLVTNDCVDSNCANGSVGVLLGNGDGTFQTAVAYGAGGIGTSSVEVADVNGDGKPDLLVANEEASCCNPINGTVGVLLGNGDGSFQTAVAYDSGGYLADSVAVADINGDGKLDLLVANSCADSTCATSGTVGALLGDGDGTFQNAVTYGSGGTRASLVAVADVNGDGKPDLLAANDVLNGTVGVLINTSISATTTTLVSSLNPANLGQSVTFTATVTAQPGYYKGTPAGPVNFNDGTTNLGSSALNSSGVATLTISTLAGGVTHSITAAYNGATDFAPSTSPVVSQVVQGALVTLSPTSLDFGTQVVPTTSSPQSVTLTNTGNIALVITSIGITGANSSEFGQTNNCPASLAANGNCTINVTFTPTAAGSASAALSIADSAPGSPQSVSLTGIGDAAVVSLSPSSVTFAGQYVGTSGLPQTVTVTNTGDATLTISNVSTSFADFGTLSNCTNSVQPGMNCTIGVFFDPTASGTRTGNLVITDNASGSPQTLTLSGTGQDFSMTPSGASTATVSPGQTANYKLSVVPGGGFKQAVTFTCSGAPSLSTCSVSPNSVVLSGSSAASVTVTLTTAGTSAGLLYPDGVPRSSNRLALWLALSGLSGLVLLRISGDRSRKWHRGLLYGLAFICLFSLGATWSACGGGGSSTGGKGGGTPAGTYNVTVTGTFSAGSTTLNHNTKLTLIVQ